MITQISKLKGFGIFSDFKCTVATVNSFKRFNLIYGWNGSGKSTLTKLFACLEKKKISNDFINAEFNVSVADELAITAQSISENTLNIRVFNEDFITDNIQWNNEKSAKSILLLSEEKIEEKKKLDIIKGQIVVQETLLRQEEFQLDVKNGEKDTFLSATAKTIKEAFKIIDTSDTHYFNYNKKKLENFINLNTAGVKKESSILAKDALTELTTSIKPTSKPELTFELNEPISEKIKDAENKIKDILSSSVISESISRLEANPEIQLWVEKGIEIHKSYQSKGCEYCGQKISKERIAELESHFNDEYKKFIARIDAALNWLNTMTINLVELPDASALYEEYQIEYLQQKASISNAYQNINRLTDEWHRLLEQKKSNPFKRVAWELRDVSDDLKNIIDCTKTVNAIKIKHNSKTINFNDVLSGQKSKLEMHYSSESIQERGYYTLIADIAKSEEKITKIKQLVAEKKSEAFQIEKELTDEVKGAAQFNEMLHSFLGRDDISLHFIPAERGYKILRKGTTDRAKNLSEGEKTAIAFIYFIIKLRENGNNIKDTIVVVDDPVSSLDSNHLIHAYSFLKNNCGDVQQLFVLTHNFNFFKLIRDWIFYIKPVDGDKAYYTIDSSSIDNKRQSALINANNFLIKYNSEYHYLFFKINQYANKQSLEMEDMYIIANLCRRFIESLITFKYPKKEKDIWEKFKKVPFDEIKKAKVYKFINLHSHNDKIESHEGFGDNLFAEGKPLVATVMEFIRAIDSSHYDELLTISNN